MNDWQQEFNSALQCAQDGRLGEKSSEELRSMLLVFSNVGRNSPLLKRDYEDAFSMVRDEIKRRSDEAAAGQRKSHHKETMDELDEIKTSVDRLGHPLWIDWAILAVGAIAAIAAVLSLFLKH